MRKCLQKTHQNWICDLSLAYIQTACVHNLKMPLCKLNPLQQRQKSLCLTFFVQIIPSKKRSGIVYQDEWAIFAPVRVCHFSKFRTEMITPVENSICFLQSTQMPLGSTCEPSSCMSSLFH